MWGYGRQPRNLAELLADLTRRDRGGDLETRSNSSKSSASNVSVKAPNRTEPRASQAPVAGGGGGAPAVIRPSAPVAVIGGTINPVLGRPAVPALNSGIPGFKTIPPQGFPAVPTAPLLPLPRPSPPAPVLSQAPVVTSQPSRPPVVAPSQPARPPVASSQPPIQPVVPSQPPRQTEPTRPPVAAPVQPTSPPVSLPTPPPVMNMPVSSQIPSPPPFSSMLTTSDGAAAPAETEGSMAAPGREAAMGARPANNASRQVAILAGSIVGAMLLAGLVAMLCIRKNKKARKAQEAKAGAPPKHEKSGSLSGPISYPVQRGNSGPWAPPLRKPTDAAPRGAPMAAAAWPMGQSNDRNSMEDGPLDDKQYLAYQNLVGNANNQITAPAASQNQNQNQTSRAPGSRDTRYLSASSADPYEQINGRYSVWPPMPPVPDANTAGGNTQHQSTVPIGFAQTPAPQAQPHTMDQFSQAARINEHYSVMERQMLSPSYHQPGARRASVAPPSPLFFRLDKQGNLGPESRR